MVAQVDVAREGNLEEVIPVYFDQTEEASSRNAYFALDKLSKDGKLDQNFAI